MLYFNKKNFPKIRRATVNTNKICSSNDKKKGFKETIAKIKDDSSLHIMFF